MAGGVLITTVQNADYNGLHQFESLTNYIEVLMGTFPRKITRKELAQKAGVSQAAITKVKKRLLKLCDPNTLIFNRRLVLRTDETFWKLFVLYFLQMKPAKILLSSYGWEMIKKMNIHSKISEQSKEYSSHFNEEDTMTIIRIVLFNLKNLQIVDQIKTSISDPQQRMMLLSTQYVTAMEGFFQRFDLPMKNHEDLLSILTIRDKLFYLTKQLLWQQVQKSDILKELSKREKTTHLEVYAKTIDFYLRKLFGNGTKLIKQVAEKRKLIFEETYEKIGCLYEAANK